MTMHAILPYCISSLGFIPDNCTDSAGHRQPNTRFTLHTFATSFKSLPSQLGEMTLFHHLLMSLTLSPINLPR